MLNRDSLRRAALLAVAAVLALAAQAPTLHAQGFKAVECTTTSADVTVTTTTEKVAIASNMLQIQSDSGQVSVFGWAQLTTGTNTTGVTPMIRRGSGITGTALTEANVEQVKAAAGSIEPFYALAVEDRAASNVQYSFTLKQTAASADGTIVQAGICIFVK